MLLFGYFQQDNNNVKFCFHLTSNFLLFFKKKGNIYIYMYVYIQMQTTGILQSKNLLCIFTKVI